jgi:hypothetical protein
VGKPPQARAWTLANPVKSAVRTLACGVLTPAARTNVFTTKGLLLAGSWAAITIAVVAMSGFNASSTSQILLASGAMVALVLTRGSRRD